FPIFQHREKFFLLSRSVTPAQGRAPKGRLSRFPHLCRLPALTPCRVLCKKLIETVRRHGVRGAQFLREKRDLEFFKHPSKNLSLGSCMRSFQASERLSIGSQLLGSFPVLDGVQAGAFGSNGQRLQISRNVLELGERDYLQEVLGQ